MRYQLKPQFVEAIQWFKIGDHPDVKPIVVAEYDRNGYLKNHNSNINSNHPEYFGGCEKTCGLLSNWHGTHIVHPGDYVVFVMQEPEWASYTTIWTADKLLQQTIDPLDLPF